MTCPLTAKLPADAPIPDRLPKGAAPRALPSGTRQSGAPEPVAEVLSLLPVQKCLKNARGAAARPDGLRVFYHG